MALYRTSRYVDGLSRDIMLIDGSGSQTRTVFRRPPRGVPTRQFHIWRAGDRLDRVANWAFGDPERAWEILDANPHILNAMSIKPGTKIRIP